MQMLSDKGCLWSWFFHYVPIGENPDVDLVPDAKQRQQILKAVYNARNTLPMMTVDFWGDGPEMMGCIAGGRQYVWDFNPWNYENEGKYIVHMRPSYYDDDKIFYDNSRWKIGSSEQLVVEDEEDNQTIINLSNIKGLNEWNEDFLSNQTNKNYDWKSWKERGFELARQVSKLLPEYVALFYLYDNDQIVKKYDDKLYLCYDGEPIRIK